MKVTEFMVVVFAALLFLIPTMNKEKRDFKIQAQEEREEEANDGKTFHVTYEVTDPNEEDIVDILWLKKAAQLAQDEGIPYFNVLEQDVSKRFVKSANQELSVIEGVIKLDNDSMRAEFDAHEIETLPLNTNQGI